MAEEIIYAYCITQKTSNLKTIENLIDSLYFVYHKGLFAVVSKVGVDEFNAEGLKKNMADLEWVKKKVWLHERVVEGIMKNSCLIPLKFATLFNSEESLKAVLEEYAEQFRIILTSLKDKEEWGVKIYCDLGKLKEVLLLEDEEILNIDKEISFSSTGKAYFLKKKEELLNIAVNKKFNEYGQMSFNRLREVSQEAGINKLLPKEVTERNDKMILNSVFLINKNKVRYFLNIVENLRAKYTDKGLFFDCTGPWPPYNFCNFSKEKVHSG